MNDQVFWESKDEMEELLQAESIGYLGLSMNGTPYVVPLNYSYLQGTITRPTHPAARTGYPRGAG